MACRRLFPLPLLLLLLTLTAAKDKRKSSSFLQLFLVFLLLLLDRPLASPLLFFLLCLMNQRPLAGAAGGASSAAPAPVLYDSSVSLQSLEALLAPLRYADKGRVARDVLGLIRNSNSLAVKVGAFGQCKTGKRRGGEWPDHESKSGQIEALQTLVRSLLSDSFSSLTVAPSSAMLPVSVCLFPFRFCVCSPSEQHF